MKKNNPSLKWSIPLQWGEFPLDRITMIGGDIGEPRQDHSWLDNHGFPSKKMILPRSNNIPFYDHPIEMKLPHWRGMDHFRESLSFLNALKSFCNVVIWVVCLVMAFCSFWRVATALFTDFPLCWKSVSAMIDETCGCWMKRRCIYSAKKSVVQKIPQIITPQSFSVDTARTVLTCSQIAFV